MALFALLSLGYVIYLDIWTTTVRVWQRLHGAFAALEIIDGEKMCKLDRNTNVYNAYHNAMQYHDTVCCLIVVNIRVL